MKIVHSDTMEWQMPRNTHRKGSIAFKRMIAGVPGAADNFHWTLVRVGAGYYTPRHRHNYDQVRLALSGRTSISPGVWLKEGQVGFFPEGTYYGPQENTEEGIVLALQGGGASGGGFLAMEQLRDGRAALEAEGRFEDGVFIRETGDGARNQDGYEAVWEKVTGTKLEYEPARYETPILMNPESFAWQADVAPGVDCRRLGSFTERGTALSYYRLSKGAQVELNGDGRRHLGFVVSGAGASAEDALRAGSAFDVTLGQHATISAGEAMLLFVVALPAVAAQARTLGDQAAKNARSAA